MGRFRLAGLCCSCSRPLGLVGPASAQDQAFVAVTAIVEHPALDAARDGVRDELIANGYEPGNLRFEYESAQNNPTTAAQIARQFVGEGPDVIVPISTPRRRQSPQRPGFRRLHRGNRSGRSQAGSRSRKTGRQHHRRHGHVAHSGAPSTDPGDYA